MTLLLPMLTFVVVFAGGLVVTRRMQRTALFLSRHQILDPAGAVVMVPQGKTTILDVRKPAGALSELAARLTGAGVRGKAEALLREAGSSMPVATYLLLRAACLFVLTPLFLLYAFSNYGISVFGVLILVVGGFTIPNLPSLAIKRRARKRAREIEHAMPDALDLLVVCAEGGLSLDAALQQVARRTEGTLTTELQRLLSEIASGKARRDALVALGQRSQSESLKIFCTAIIQADKVGMSIGNTLRTLAETMRMRRRQAAETQARKAPIKMLPFLVFFMIPSLFIIILGPAALSIMGLGDIQ